MSRFASTLVPIRASALLQTGAARPATACCPAIPASSAAAPAPAIPSPTTQYQARHATLIRRPRRPYTFTQLVQLSDGSTFTIRTTSPHAMYRAAKDSRNHARWNPSEKSLRNVEVDEAGKLAAFRERYGRGWDLAQPPRPTAAADVAEGKETVEEGPAAGATAAAAPSSTAAAAEEEDDMDLADLIGNYAEAAGMKAGGGLSAKQLAKGEKGEKGKKGKKK